jgi:hypothetical protein
VLRICVPTQYTPHKPWRDPDLWVGEIESGSADAVIDGPTA